jgi:hypothetical protein
MIIEDPAELQMYIDFMIKEKVYDDVNSLIEDLRYEHNIIIKEEQINQVEWSDIENNKKNEC